jgi:hypothetical protein
MSLYSVIISLVTIGIILWLVNNYIPMDIKIKSILNGVVVIFVVLWLLRAFVVFDAFAPLHIQGQ